MRRRWRCWRSGHRLTQSFYIEPVIRRADVAVVMGTRTCECGKRVERALACDVAGLR